MTHNTTVTTETFQRLKEWQRHLVMKHNTLMIPGDILVCNEQDTRNQLEFEIKSIEPLHSRSDLVGLYAPYTAVDDIPDSVGGGYNQLESVGAGHSSGGNVDLSKI